LYRYTLGVAAPDFTVATIAKTILPAWCKPDPVLPPLAPSEEEAAAAAAEAAAAAAAAAKDAAKRQMGMAAGGAEKTEETPPTTTAAAAAAPPENPAGVATAPAADALEPKVGVCYKLNPVDP
jgi:hypothetical protein